MKNETLYTVDGAAKQLDISPSRVRGLANAGQLPCLRASNGDRLFRSKDLAREALRRAAKRREA